MPAKKQWVSLDFKKVAKILNVLLHSDTTANIDAALTALGQLGYDTTLLRAKIYDGVAVRKLLQDNDIDIDGTMAANSDSVVPSQKAVRTYISAQVQSGVKIRGSLTITANPADYPKGDAATAVNATQVGNGSGAGPTIKAGDAWSIKGGEHTIGPNLIAVNTGDLLIALNDGSGNLDTDWLILEKNDTDSTTANKGLVQLATRAEAEAQVDQNKAVTPFGLQDFGLKKQYTITGDGLTTSFVITHNLGTRSLVTNVREAQAPYGKVDVSDESTTTNDLTIAFDAAPAVGVNYTVIIIA
jgi:hypothetical protein